MTGYIQRVPRTPSLFRRCVKQAHTRMALLVWLIVGIAGTATATFITGHL